MLLTKASTPIIGWIAVLLGYVMEFIYFCLDKVGIHNIGLCIIFFTLFVRLIMLPLTVKQQRFTRLTQAMQPELNKIQKKYRGKKDQASMEKQNKEIQEVYAKYGVSPSGGCAQMLVQLPLFLGLYQVIRNIPAYIPQVKEIYTNIVNVVGTNQASINTINKIVKSLNSNYIKAIPKNGTVNQIIDALSGFNATAWKMLADSFPAHSDQIASLSKEIIDMNTFVGGINVAQIPGFRLSPYLIIAFLAAFFQFLSTKTMQQPQDGENSQAANMTRSMTWMMPLMSLYFCIIMPAGLGIYWATSAAFQCLQQVLLNMYFDKQDLDEMVAKNLEKAEKKRKSGKKSLVDKVMDKTKDFRNTDTADTGSEEYSESKMYHFANMKTKKLVPPLMEGKEYYGELERRDMSNSGVISKRAYMVSEYDKKNKQTPNGGKK